MGIVARCALLVVAVTSLLVLTGRALEAQSPYAPPVGSTPVAPAPEPAPAQHGAQPNFGEVRPGSADGDSPSAAAGALSPEQHERRIFGLPVTAVIVISGVLVALLVFAAFVAPRARRRQEARGGGTYGSPR